MRAIACAFLLEQRTCHIDALLSLFSQFGRARPPVAGRFERYPSAECSRLLHSGRSRRCFSALMTATLAAFGSNSLIWQCSVASSPSASRPRLLEPEGLLHFWRPSSRLGTALASTSVHTDIQGDLSSMNTDYEKESEIQSP
ncbi:MAG: hypothetical protein Q7J47_22670 [Azoarcus sp.]|nr:hypothetical protein [Azoarcus sp.]